jgi:Putative Flp pilus-assembly TadE/G-like
MLFTSGLLLGVAALTVDVGTWNSEKRQLQNAADASALSMARTCALAESNCNFVGATTSLGSASITQLANANSQDGTSGLDTSVYGNGVCGSATISTVIASLPRCNAPTASLGDCLPLPTWITTAPAPGIKYVESHTLTQDRNGSSVLPASFGQFITGRSSYTLAACSRAAYGPPGNGTGIIPVSFSQCDWFLDTANGTSFPVTEVALAFNSANNSACTAKYGHDFPGGFGWLTHDSTCVVSTDANGWVDANTGIGAANDCATQINSAVGREIFIPVFDCMDKNKSYCGNTANGTQTFYHVIGYAGFYLTAVSVNGQILANLPGYPSAAANSQCISKGGKCFFGWWTQSEQSSGVIDPRAQNLGSQIIKPAG